MGVERKRILHLRVMGRNIPFLKSARQLREHLGEAKTHEANENALKTLRPMFGTSKLADIDAIGRRPTRWWAYLSAKPATTSEKWSVLG